jgi:hypothetical protein
MVIIEVQLAHLCSHGSPSDNIKLTGEKSSCSSWTDLQILVLPGIEWPRLHNLFGCPDRQRR